MTTSRSGRTSTLPEPPAHPGAVLRAQVGVVVAGAAVGVGHLVAAVINPVASPLLAVGSALIDAAPTPAKEFAVRTFGTNDKPILVSSVGVAVVIFGAIVGLIAWRRPRIATGAIGLLGVAGAGAALTRGPWTDAIPSVVAGADRGSHVPALDVGRPADIAHPGDPGRPRGGWRRRQAVVHRAGGPVRRPRDQHREGRGCDVADERAGGHRALSASSGHRTIV